MPTPSTRRWIAWEQDAKTRELVDIRDAGRQDFSRSVGPILLEYMRESGASVMLDRRSVVVAADRVDVTDELIAEVDERVGAGELPTSLDAAPAAETDGTVAPPAPDAEEPLLMPPIGEPPAPPDATAPLGPPPSGQ